MYSSKNTFYKKPPHPKNPYAIYGFHPIIEAIQAGKTIEKIFLQKDLRGDLYGDFMSLIKDYKEIHIQKVPKEKLNRLTPKNHQGIFAFISPIDYHKVEDILPTLYEEGKNPLFLVLEDITDVRNFGAISRSAAAMGVDALIIPSKGAALISQDAIKTSAGGIFKLPICKESSLEKTLDYLKNSGILLISTTSNQKAEPPEKIDFSLPLAILLGNEEKGLSDNLLKLSSKSLKIPILDKVESLNVSVAAGIILYEVSRQRNLINI